jgi:hypothetical protein
MRALFFGQFKIWKKLDNNLSILIEKIKTTGSEVPEKV